jgi:hypothetical protein
LGVNEIQNMMVKQVLKQSSQYKTYERMASKEQKLSSILYTIHLKQIKASAQ